MMIIRLAGANSPTFCQNFFRGNANPPSGLQDELLGLVSSLDGLDAYRGMEDRLQVMSSISKGEDNG
ncbi:MAG: hypothetical protein AAGC81_02935 [Pseudomonadota bacterium]